MQHFNTKSKFTLDTESRRLGVSRARTEATKMRSFCAEEERKGEITTKT